MPQKKQYKLYTRTMMTNQIELECHQTKMIMVSTGYVNSIDSLVNWTQDQGIADVAPIETLDAVSII